MFEDNHTPILPLVLRLFSIVFTFLMMKELKKKISIADVRVAVFAVFKDYAIEKLSFIEFY